MGTRNILVATDLSARSDRPMERAVLLAEQLGASLVALHVPGREPLSADEESELCDHIRREFEMSRVQSEIAFEYGPVPTVVAAAAKARGSTLIVTGVARFDSPRDYILGTTVDYLVRQSPVPVLVVKCRAAAPYRRLLVATDFSDCSADAVKAAASLFPDAAIRTVHSFHAAWEAFLSHDTTEPVVRAEAERAMKAFLEALPGDLSLRAEPVLEEGHLGSIIAGQEEAWGADLLVVGSHGRGGFAHATIGDTASQLLNSAPIDVLVVRGHEGGRVKR